MNVNIAFLYRFLATLILGNLYRNYYKDNHEIATTVYLVL